MTRDTIPEQPAGAREPPRLASGLVGGFAHEIKNPLSTIGLNLRLLEEELGTPENAREKRILTLSQRVSKEVVRLQDSLEDFLNFVRAPKPVLQHVSLNGIVREVTDLIAPSVERQGLRLQLLLTEGLPVATVDGRLVHQALWNLVLNAQQALVGAKRQGEIIIGTGYEAAESGQDAGDGRPCHVLTVTDSGPGMAPDVVEQCFSPYYSTKKGGTGLGLAITQRFVQDHGGTIDVSSQEGVGTRFALRFPHVDLQVGPQSAATGKPT